MRASNPLKTDWTWLVRLQMLALFVATHSFVGCDGPKNSEVIVEKQTKQTTTEQRSLDEPATIFPPASGQKADDHENVSKDTNSEKVNHGQATEKEVANESSSNPTVGDIYFEHLGKEAGLDFRREDDIRGLRRIFESTGGGVGAIDLDNDGLLDLFYTGACRLPLEPGALKPTCALFRNIGSMRFSSVTQPTRLIQGGYCQGVTVGDFDNDGFDDLYVTAFGENRLWKNCGDGTFTDDTESAGVRHSSWSTSCAFADLDTDGDLDLYVANYLKDSAEHPLQCPNPRSPDGFEQCPPSKYEGLDDVLFLNQGDGTFEDITEQAQLSGLRGKGLGVVVCDFDRNGIPEIYVANDGEANFLLVNESRPGEKPRYSERGLSSGVALSRAGYAQASMGIASGDYDSNGTIDLIVANFYGDYNTVYRNFGTLNFEDSTRSSGLLGPSRMVLGWGMGLIDFNADTQLDLYVANGHVEDRTWTGLPEPYQMPQQVFRNVGGKFEENSQKAGTYFAKNWLARGTAFGDFDQDGLVDVAISHQLENSAVLKNSTKIDPKTSFKNVRFIGRKTNRNGVGVKVEALDSDGKVLYYRELVGGSSFQSSSSYQVFLVNLGKIARIRVAWPSGQKQETQWHEGDIIIES